MSYWRGVLGRAPSGLLYVVVAVAVLWWGFDEDLAEAVIVGFAAALIAILIPTRTAERSPEESGQDPR